MERMYEHLAFIERILRCANKADLCGEAYAVAQDSPRTLVITREDGTRITLYVAVVEESKTLIDRRRRERRREPEADGLV